MFYDIIATTATPGTLHLLYRVQDKRRTIKNNFNQFVKCLFNSHMPVVLKVPYSISQKSNDAPIKRYDWNE